MIWQSKTLGELCDAGGGTIKTGPFGSQLHESDYVAEGVPVVMPKDIYEGRVLMDTVAQVDENNASRLSQHALRPGDIVYGRRGDIGRQAFITERERGWLCGTGCLRVTIGQVKELEPHYLHYYLRAPEVIAWISNHAIGATMPNLNTSILRSVPVRFPDLPTQRKIAAILSAYDDLIENNTRRVRVLEDMARALYREWFVEYRYPGHEHDEFVEDEQGRRPKGWAWAKVGERVELLYGKALKAEDRKPGPYPVYGSGGVVGHHSLPLSEGPGVIVGRKGNVGAVYWSDAPFFPIDTVYYVRSRLPLHYLYFNLQGQNFINSDAAVPGLSRNQAYSLPLLVPDDNTLFKFSAFAGDLFEALHSLRHRNANLRRTRDLLLPQLVSGELDVSGLNIRGAAEDVAAEAEAVA